jgi:hypothetical protein
METKAGNIILILIHLFLAVWFISFLFTHAQPSWIHLAGLAGVVLFIARIFRGDD